MWSIILQFAAALGALVAAAAAGWGLIYARGVITDRRVDRVLTLHSELTGGDVGAARNRFSELMFRAGEATLGPNSCWRPTWESLLPPSPACESASAASRF